MHLHHRLLSIGHSHRRAVLVMYFWAALLSFGAVGAVDHRRAGPSCSSPIGVLLVVGVVVVLSPRARRAAREARAAELAAQRERSRAEHPTARALRLAAAAPTPGPRPASRPTGRWSRDAAAAWTPAGTCPSSGWAPWSPARSRVVAALVTGLLAGWQDALGVLVGRGDRDGVLRRLGAS